MTGTIRTMVSSLLVLTLAGAALAGEQLTDETVIAFVQQVSKEVMADAPGTFAKIIAAEHPYKNKDNAAFYVFIYDTEVNIVAHPKATLVGKSYKGKPDIKGNNFRDEIVEGALKGGTGWVNYFYQKPGQKGIKPKKTYYQLVTGSDGQQYVVCCGKYRVVK
jgi:polar amino acid transport system substrate-binding protein